MPSYSFWTITAADALAITANDTLLIDQASANATTVQFGTSTVFLTVGATTIAFGTKLSSATTTFADGSRLFVGTPGNDSPAAFGPENNGLYGGDGADTLVGGDGLNQLQGNQGNDRLMGGSDRDVIYGGQDNDIIFLGASVGGGGTNFGQGNKGEDTINGSPVDNDTLLGGQGNDVLGVTDVGFGIRSDRFVLYSNPTGPTGGGNDFINGNLGNDYIQGGTGNDTLMGEEGMDQIRDVAGSNIIDGGTGDDFIEAGDQATVNSGPGSDVVHLGLGEFVVTLGDGNDACIGGFRYSDGAGNSERATVDGGEGRDLIHLGDGADSINGGAGNDVLSGAGGADTIAGGAGRDEFDFFGGQGSTVYAELDLILDWNSEDYLYFQDLASDAAIGAGTAQNYVESVAADYNAALVFANAQVAAGNVQYVVMQVGSDLLVFADSRNDDGMADTAVRLAGRSLDDISMSNFLTG